MVVRLAPDEEPSSTHWELAKSTVSKAFAVAFAGWFSLHIVAVAANDGP
jgi:hypothetical protein